MYIILVQRLLIDLLLDVLRFPFWWYSDGIKRAFLFVWDAFKTGNSYLAPGLWLRNIFVPMFGQTDIQGRITSFIVRVGNIMVRTVFVLVWLIFCIGVFLIWPILPVVITAMIIISLLPVS